MQGQGLDLAPGCKVYRGWMRISELAESARSPPADEPDEAPRSGNLFDRLKAMTVAEKMQLALTGSRDERMALLRDNAKTIHVFVLKNPRIGLAYFTAFASRGDLVIVTTFISLWVVQAGTEAGLSVGAATARAGMVFGTSQLAGLVWPLVMGNRLHVVPPLNIEEATLREGLAIVDEALRVVDRFYSG